MANEIANIKRYVRSVLKKAGKWSPEMGYQVELLATDLLIYRQLRDELLGGEVLITEKSREGHTRKKVHPAVSALKQQADAVRADLKSLLMNREIERDGVGDDGGLLAELMGGQDS